MPLSRRVTVPLSAMLLALSTVSTAAAGPAAPAFELPAPPPLGEISPETVDKADELMALAEAEPDKYTSVRIDASGELVVTLPAGADSGTLRAQAGVRVQHSARSLADIRRTKEEVLGLITAGTYQGKVIGVGVDPVKATALVYATGDSDAARIDLKQRFGDAVGFRQQDGMGQALGRSKDTKHYGGTGIRMWNPARTVAFGTCSTAFAVRVNGIAHMLTAGHCFPAQTSAPRAWSSSYTPASPPPSDAYYQGAMVTSTLSGDISAVREGTQDSRGDFALLQGAAYRPWVYSCAKNAEPCGTLAVGSANWGTPSNSTEICTSGLTTGQTCRQFVTDNDYSGYIAYHPTPLLVRNLAVFNSDQNRDGVYDCGGIEPGDSGGAVYRGLGGGKVEALGNITSGGTAANGICYYQYTKLSGLVLWNPGIQMMTQ